MRKKRLLLILLFLAAGFSLRAVNLSGRSLWTDEFFTFFQSTGHGETQKFLNTLSEIHPPRYFKTAFFKQMTRNDPSRTLNDVTMGLVREDTHPPLYFWIMYFWMRIFGDGVFAVRFFSVLTGLICIVLSYMVTRVLFGDEAAIFCALFLSICPFAVVYSREARHYSLITALALAAWLFLLRFEREGRNKDLIAATLLNAFAMLTHYFYFFILLAQLVYFAAVHRNNKNALDKFLLSFFASFLLITPWFFLVITHGYNYFLASWLFRYPGLAGKIYYSLIAPSRYIFVFEPSGTVARILLLAGLGALAFWIRPIIKELLSRYRREAIFCLIMFLVPLLIISAIDIIQQGVLLKQERFLVFPFIGAIPLAGYCLYRLFIRNKKIFSSCCLFFFVYSMAAGANPQFGPAPKGSAEWINSESRGHNSAVITVNVRSVVLAQAYYMDDGIIFMPVSDDLQMREGIRVLGGLTDKIFIVRHLNRTDPTLADQGFIGAAEIGNGFKLIRMGQGDYVKTLEFAR